MILEKNLPKHSEQDVLLRQVAVFQNFFGDMLAGDAVRDGLITMEAGIRIATGRQLEREIDRGVREI